MPIPDKLTLAYERAMKRLNSWGMLLTGRIAGTLRSDDPRAKGYRDLFQKLLAMRVEVNALTYLMLQKGLVDEAELLVQFRKEAELINAQYEQSFPGIRATDEGLDFFDAVKAAEYMKGWPQ